MTGNGAEQVRAEVEAVYRSESRRVLATLIRLLGDFDLAEDALHEAFAAAVEQWPRDGTPANPRAWLVSAGRFKAIDSLRRRARFDASLGDLAERLDADAQDALIRESEDVEDDRLRLIFTCCHPALPPAAQVALDAAGGLRPHDRGDRARLPQRADGRRPAHRPRQGEDPGRAHPLSGAGARRSAGPARHRAPRDLPGVQRGILRVLRRLADAARSLGRGDPAGAALDRALAGARGAGAPGADAAPRVAARRADVGRGRAGPARRPGPIALEPGADRGGGGAGGTRARLAPHRALHAPGGDRGGPRPGAHAPPRRTGPRSSASTTCWSGPIRRRSSS